MRAAGSVVLAAATIAFRCRVEFTTTPGVVVRYLAVPSLTAWLFLAFASGGTDRVLTTRDALTAGLATAALASSTALSELMSTDRFEGVTPFTFTAFRGRLLGWIGRAGFVSAMGTITGVVGVATAAVTVAVVSGAGIAFEDLIAIPLASISSLGVGLVVGSVGLVHRDSLLWSNIVQRALPIVCGVVAPLGSLVAGWDVLSGLFPLGRLLESTRGGTLGETGDLVTLTVSATAWIVVGLVLTKTFEKVAHRRGTTELLTLG